MAVIALNRQVGFRSGNLQCPENRLLFRLGIAPPYIGAVSCEQEMVSNPQPERS
jgi:hypothetical protein